MTIKTQILCAFVESQGMSVMAEQPIMHVMTFFSEYVKMRQQGSSVDEAAHELQHAAHVLNKKDLDELALLTQNWEARYGRQMHQSMTSSAIRRITPENASPRPNSPIRPLPAKNAAPARNVIRPLKIAKRDDTPMTCPQCSKPNRSDEYYCYSCGHMLITRTSTRQLDETQGSPTVVNATYFGPRFALVMTVRDTGQIIEFVPGNSEIVLGRRSKDSPVSADVDLSEHKAEALGVSRLHAMLKRQNDTLTIMDLNSSNKTYINGQRIHPHEVRALRDGDELRLGKMRFTVAFKPQ